MNKNYLEALYNSCAKFSDKFCQNKFESQNSKCKLFYKKNANSIEKIHVCPYGYMCYFNGDVVYSTIIDDKYSDLKKIKKRASYDSRFSQGNIMTIIPFDKLYEAINNSEKMSYLSTYKDTYHDLNNNNRYLLDCVNSIPEYEIKKHVNIIKSIVELSNLFLGHKNRIDGLVDDDARFLVYKSVIDFINDKCYELLSNPIIKNEELFCDLKKNLEFIDYRIRYLKRIVEGNAYKEEYKKNLNIINIIMSLKYSFDVPSKKKGQHISVNINNRCDEEFCVYDDIYVAFFVLFENATKYAPFDTDINVNIDYKEKESLTIVFENRSEEVGPINEIMNRGTQGLNHKAGSGLGLSIAKEIFELSMIDFRVEYSNNVFRCVLNKKAY